MRNVCNSLDFSPNMDGIITNLMKTLSRQGNLGHFPFDKRRPVRMKTANPTYTVILTQHPSGSQYSSLSCSHCRCQRHSTSVWRSIRGRAVFTWSQIQMNLGIPEGRQGFLC